MGFLTIKSAIKLSVEGLAIVPVKIATCLPALFASAKLAFNLESTSPNEALLVAIFGDLIRVLSYNDKIEACTLAFA